MNITFIYHSAFLVELERCSLLFDWYGGELPEIDRTKPLYVFASHHHGDHYSPEIFSRLGMENVWYILATCIRLSAKRKGTLKIHEDHLYRMMARSSLDLGELHITTYRSTDAGVAFYVEAEGKTIFHAGDLQWWHWEEEPKAWNTKMEQDFKEECARLAGKQIDVAFLVLDPRQEKFFWWGLDWWMRHVEIKTVFPMHSWEDFSIVKRLKSMSWSEPYREKVREIYFNGQIFTSQGDNVYGTGTQAPGTL